MHQTTFEVWYSLALDFYYSVLKYITLEIGFLFDILLPGYHQGLGFRLTKEHKPFFVKCRFNFLNPVFNCSVLQITEKKEKRQKMEKKNGESMSAYLEPIMV